MNVQCVMRKCNSIKISSVVYFTICNMHSEHSLYWGTLIRNCGRVVPNCESKPTVFFILELIARIGGRGATGESVRAAVLDGIVFVR